MAKQNSPLVLGTEPIGKLLTQYAIPAIIAMTASSLYIWPIVFLLAMEWGR